MSRRPRLGGEGRTCRIGRNGSARTIKETEPIGLSARSKSTPPAKPQLRPMTISPSRPSRRTAAVKLDEMAFACAGKAGAAEGNGARRRGAAIDAELRAKKPWLN